MTATLTDRARTTADRLLDDGLDSIMLGTQQARDGVVHMAIPEPR